MNDITKKTEPSTASIQADIAQTKDSLAATIRALEAKFQQGDLQGKIDAKIEQVEGRAKQLLAEGIVETKQILSQKLVEAKSLMKEEMGEAKAAIKEEMDVLEVKARKGASDAADRLRSEVYHFKDSLKCDVRNAITDAKQSLRAATVGRVEDLASNIGDTMTETKTTIIETVRANPIPAALIGAGLAWLFINRTKSTQMKSRRYEGNFAGETEGVIDEGRGFVEAQVSKAAHQAVDAAGNVMRSAGGQINAAAQNVADAAGKVSTTVQTKAKALAQNAGQVGTRIATQAGQVYDRTATMAKQGVQQVGDTYNTTLQENPLLIAGAAIGFGLLIGFSLPRTRPEDQLMGSQRDRLLQRAGQTLGQSIKDGASSIANMAEDAMDKAQRGSKEPARA